MSIKLLRLSITILLGLLMMALIELRDDRSEKIQYDNPDYPIYNRRRILSHYPNYAAPSHWHDDVELISILGGEMSYNVNGSIMKLKKGEGLFVNSGQLHFGFSDSKAECDFICIVLHPLLLCAAPAYEQDFVMPVIRNSSMPYVFLDPNVRWQRDILEQIYLIDQGRGRKSEPLKVQSAFSVIWSLLYENLPLEGRRANSKSNDLMIARNMVGFIQKNYTQRITLKEIALSGAVGQSKCCKLFATLNEQI